MERAGLKVDADALVKVMRASAKMPLDDAKLSVARVTAMAKRQGIDTDTVPFYKALIPILFQARMNRELLSCWNMISSTSMSSAQAQAVDGDDDEDDDDDDKKNATLLSEMRMAILSAARGDYTGVLYKLMQQLFDEQLERKLDAKVMLRAFKALAHAQFKREVSDVSSMDYHRMTERCFRALPQPPTADAYHAMLASCSRTGRGKSALEILTEMKEHHKPLRASYQCVLSATSKEGMFSESQAVLDEMEAQNIPLNTVTLNIAIAARANVGDIQGVLKILNEDMVRDGLKPTVVTYASAINAAAKANNSYLALGLLQAGLQVYDQSEKKVAPTAGGETGAGDVVEASSPKRRGGKMSASEQYREAFGELPVGVAEGIVKIKDVSSLEILFSSALEACLRDPSATVGSAASVSVLDLISGYELDDESRQRVVQLARAAVRRDVAVLDPSDTERIEGLIGATVRGRSMEV